MTKVTEMVSVNVRNSCYNMGVTPKLDRPVILSIIDNCEVNIFMRQVRAELYNRLSYADYNI